MTTQSKISKILLAAALGAGSTAYATEQNNYEPQPSVVGGDANADNRNYASKTPVLKNNSAPKADNTYTTSNTTSTTTNFASASKLLYESTPIYQRGLFTDTKFSSYVYEREEVEFVESPEQVDAPVSNNVERSTNSINVAYKSASVGALKKNINTYLENVVCTGNIFYTRCEGTTTRVSTRPAPQPAVN